MYSIIINLPVRLSIVAASLVIQAFGQSTATEPVKNNANDEAVKMSMFVVNDTTGVGYAESNSLSGFKTNQALLDIPQTSLILTQDFLKDVPFDSKISDLLMYVGVASFYRSSGFGEGTMVRGSRIGVGLTDGMLAPGWISSDFIDSVEVLKGATSALYQGNATTGGLLKTTKKPLTKKQNLVTLGTDNFGKFRGVVDSTGPVGQLGDAKLSYRFIGGYESGGTFYANDELKMYNSHATFQIDYKKTSLVLAFDYEHFHGNYNANGALTPTGDIYQGVERKYQGFWFPKMAVDGTNRAARLIFSQNISDNWEMRFSAINWRQQEYGGNAVPTAINYQNNTVSGIFRQNNQPINTYQILGDITGRNRIGTFNFSTTTGFAHSDNTNISKFWTSVKPPRSATWSIPLGPTMGAAIDQTYVPQFDNGDYLIPANPGTRVKTYSDLLYFQEQIDISKWLTVSAGAAFVQTESITDTNISFNTPYSSVDVNFHTWTPRYAVIFHPTKETSIYVLKTSNAAVQGNVDINNNRLPNVEIDSKEIGAKAVFLKGKLVANFTYFQTVQSNQSLFSGFINAAGVGYFLPVGTTENKGWDASLAYSPVPAWQFIATGYKGTVLDQLGRWISPSFGNSWSFFNRYNFNLGSNKKLAIGGGISRIGERWIGTGPMTFPVGWVKPAFLKMKSGTNMMGFVDYKFAGKWEAHFTVTNLLDENFPIGLQSVAIVNPLPPRTFSATITYAF